MNKDVKEELRTWPSCCHKPRKQRAMSLVSQTTKASYLTTARSGTKLAEQKNSKVYVQVSSAPRKSLPDVVHTSNANYKRRESNWSTLTTHTMLNGSICGESRRSLSNISSNSSDSDSSVVACAAAAATRGELHRLSLCSDTDLQRTNERPQSLGIEMVEICEPLMDDGHTDIHILLTTTDTSGLGDIEEETTSQLSPVVEVDV